MSVCACLSKDLKGERAMQTTRRRLGVGTSRAKDLRQKSWRDKTTGGGGEGGSQGNPVRRALRSMEHIRGFLLWQSHDCVLTFKGWL